MVVLDTSALLFWTLAPERLSERASAAIETSPELLVSSISLWEIGVKAAKGKLEIPVSLREYSERLSRVERVEILSVDLETWLFNLELSWDHRDPADRTIVATASLRGCPLVTSDAKILDFYSDGIW
jgi:PIN domain nuclease of toxin-antitoxin system